MNLRQAAKLVPLGRTRLSELTVLTTTACNFRCRHCFMIAELNKRVPELSAEEMRKMSAHMPKLRRVHLGGGEPFSQRDIGDKALVAANEWRAEITCIPTNGWYAQNVLDTIEAFGKHGTGQLRIHFSINTMPEDMDAFTGVQGSFKRWRESIRNAIDHASAYKNVTVLCLATYNEDSKSVFGRLKDYIVNDVQPNDVSMQLAREHEHYRTDYDTDGFDEVVRDYFRNDSKQPWFLTAYRELIREHTSACSIDPSRIPKCTSGTTRIVLAPNGDVYPCESKGYPNGSDYRDWLMGNIRDYDFDIGALLLSTRASGIRQRLASEPCSCQHGIDIAQNLLHSPLFQAKVVARGLVHAIHRSLPRLGLRPPTANRPDGLR